jgi:holliday junction DNA helicase RuvA
MIDMLWGKIAKVQPTYILLNVNGVGYGLQMSLNSSSYWAHKDGEIAIPTWLQVREDVQQLFGFINNQEREVFLQLISVNGIGAKVGQRILSECTPQELANWIHLKNITALMKLKGIGKKTAELIILTLENKLTGLELNPEIIEDGSPVSLDTSKLNEAKLALVSLGLKENQAEKAIGKANKMIPTAKLEDLITEALKYL